MHRFSARNILGWVAGVSGLVAVAGFYLGNLWGPVGVIAVIAAAVSGGLWIYQQVEKFRHAQQLREFALLNGWTYAEGAQLGVSRLTGFPFGLGSKRRAEDVIRGSYRGLDFVSYTYVFEHRVGDERAAEQVFTVAQVPAPTRLRRLELVPEDAGSRVLGALGAADIDLESAEFNRQWRVLCDDRRYAIDFLDPRMMEHLIAGHLLGVAVRVDGDSIMAWSAGRADVRDLARRLGLIVGVAERVPAHVVRTYSELDAQRRAWEAEREANAPSWAKTPGALTSRRYTGIGAQGDSSQDEDGARRDR